MQRQRASGYREGEPLPLCDIPTRAGAGALRSTVRDLLTFLEANIGLRESRLFEAMQITHKARFPVAAEMMVGLAWHIRIEGNVQIGAYHGATGGYWGFAGFIKDEQEGVVILTNTIKDIDWIGLELLRAAASETSPITEMP